MVWPRSMPQPTATDEITDAIDRRLLGKMSPRMERKMGMVDVIRAPDKPLQQYRTV